MSLWNSMTPEINFKEKPMNGFALMADSYRKAADQGEIDKAQAEAKIRIFDFLATCLFHKMIFTLW